MISLFVFLLYVRDSHSTRSFMEDLNKSVNTHVFNFENRVFTQSFYAFGEAP